MVSGREPVLIDHGVDLGAIPDGGDGGAGREDEWIGMVVRGGGGGAEEEAEEGEGVRGVGAAGVGADEGVVGEGVKRSGRVPEEEGGVEEGGRAEGAGCKDEAGEGRGVPEETVGDEEGVDGVELPLVGAALEEEEAPLPSRWGAHHLFGRFCVRVP